MLKTEWSDKTNHIGKNHIGCNTNHSTKNQSGSRKSKNV